MSRRSVRVRGQGRGSRDNGGAASNADGRSGEAGPPVSCATCVAWCCRLEVVCLTDTGVPRYYTTRDAWGRTLMERLDDGWCAALDRQTLRCRIYDQRPLVCRELEVGSPECLAERAAGEAGC